MTVPQKPLEPRFLPPRDAGHLAHWSVQRAATMSVMVRDEGCDRIGDYLDGFNRQELYGLVVALAAMVPDDRTVDELLEWIAPAPRRRSSEGEAA